MPNPAHAKSRIVILTAGGPLAEAVINAVNARYLAVTVIQEDPESIKEIARRWVRLLGVRRAVGQLAFGPLQKLVAIRARSRRAEILNTAGLTSTLDPGIDRVSVPTVNSEQCRHALVELQPRVVLVVGTRIIRSVTLSSINAPFINYHAGVNPKYRGQYGGYWAIANDDRENAGVTVHLVDKGVDTGPTLYKDRFTLAATDTIATIHYRQLVVAMPLIFRALDDALNDALKPQKPIGASTQWFHPTIAEYLANGFRKGLW